MRELRIYIDDEVYGWLETHRGSSAIDAFAARALDEHIHGRADSERLHKAMIKKLEDVEARIKRLNSSLGGLGSK